MADRVGILFGMTILLIGFIMAMYKVVCKREIIEAQYIFIIIGAVITAYTTLNII